LIHLPPIVPVVDARPEPALPAQVRRLGDAGFPLVLVRAAAPAGEAQRQGLEPAREASWENGGWPTLVLEDWGSAGPGCDQAGVGPVRFGSRPSRGLDLETLARGCSDLRDKGLAPAAFGELDWADAPACFRAGVETLLLAPRDLPAARLAELLWEAQCARWRVRPPLHPERGVALVGGSGCGKSTLARVLAGRLRLPAKDLDEAVVRRAGKPISRIFSEDGEAAFRTLETEVTREAFRSPAVLALGGGAWESEPVRRAARESGYGVLWIAENPGLAWRRVAGDPLRPLSGERERFMARWRARVPAWREAPMVLPLGRSPGQLADALGETRGS